MQYFSISSICSDARRGKIKPHQGFTLVEFLIAIVILGITVTLAAPSFYPLLQSYHVSSTANLIERGLRYARREAVLKNKTVRICPSADGQYCASNLDWSSGFISYIDLDNDGLKQQLEETLDIHIPSHPVTVTFNRRQQISFNGSGRSGTIGTFSICDPQHRVNARKITLIHSGRLRKFSGPANCA